MQQTATMLRKTAQATLSVMGSAPSLSPVSPVDVSVAPGPVPLTLTPRLGNLAGERVGA